MIATYRLSECIPSFEFSNWLIMAKAEGASKIAFDLSNPKIRKKHTYFGPENIMRRFHSIVEPMPALAGLKHRMGNDRSSINPVSSQLLPWWISGRRFSRLQSIKPPVACDFTVTIRDNRDGARGRDSRRDAWQRFAEEIGAAVIDDYNNKPIHLHDRMALYAGAKMNFGVCNGPVHTISLTPYPVSLWVNTESARNTMMRWGMQPDQSYPWMLENQRIIWQKDTLDNLLRAFEAMRLC